MSGVLHFRTRESPGAAFLLRTGSNGFSLVELLVSMAVLILVMSMVAQMMNGTIIVTSNSRKRLDADGQARFIFDRIAGDLARMVLRNDIDRLFIKAPGNDCLFFYSEAPGYSTGADQSTVSLVGYRIRQVADPTDSTKTLPQLERLGKGLNWTGGTSGSAASPVFLTYSGDHTAPDPASTLAAGSWSNVLTASGVDPDFQVVGDQVFRLEFAYVLSDGTHSNRPVRNPSAFKNNLSATTSPTAADNASAGYAVGSRWYDSVNFRAYICTAATSSDARWSGLGMKDVAGIVVSLGILDSSSQLLVADKSKLGAGFSDPTEAELQGNPPTLMVQSWTAAINNGTAVSGGGIPVAAASHIRVYQRIFYLNQIFQE